MYYLLWKNVNVPIYNIFVFRSNAYCARRLLSFITVMSLKFGRYTLLLLIVYGAYNIVSSVFNYCWWPCRTGLPKWFDSRLFVSGWFRCLSKQWYFHLVLSVVVCNVCILLYRDYNIIIVIRRGFPHTGITTTTCYYTTFTTTSVNFSPYTSRPSQLRTFS